MKYSKEEAILAIKTLANTLGRTPSSRDYRKYKIKPSISVVQKLFGSWSSALEQVNLEPITIVKYSKEDVIAALISYYNATGKVPRYNDISNPGSTTAEKHFGSWNAAIEAAGLTPNLLKNIYTKENIIEALVTFYKEEKKVPLYSDFANNKYPSSTTVCRYFGSWNEAIKIAGFRPVLEVDVYNKDSIILAIKKFTALNGRVPTYEDFKHSEEYPSPTTVRRYFSTWNTAIESAGLKPNEPNFGNPTVGKDNHLYRSAAEAYFCDKFLYGRYDYIVEPKYPEPYRKYYDWYVPSLDLYIELDGELRPDAVNSKRTINEELHRNCIIITVKDMYKITNLNFLQEWCDAR
jgi:hypothetical protein